MMTPTTTNLSAYAFWNRINQLFKLHSSVCPKICIKQWQIPPNREDEPHQNVSTLPLRQQNTASIFFMAHFPLFVLPDFSPFWSLCKWNFCARDRHDPSRLNILKYFVPNMSSAIGSFLFHDKFQSTAPLRQTFTTIWFVRSSPMHVLVNCKVWWTSVFIYFLFFIYYFTFILFHFFLFLYKMDMSSVVCFD